MELILTTRNEDVISRVNSMAHAAIAGEFSVNDDQSLVVDNIGMTGDLWSDEGLINCNGAMQDFWDAFLGQVDESIVHWNYQTWCFNQINAAVLERNLPRSGEYKVSHVDGAPVSFGYRTIGTGTQVLFVSPDDKTMIIFAKGCRSAIQGEILGVLGDAEVKEVFYDSYYSKSHGRKKLLDWNQTKRDANPLCFEDGSTYPANAIVGELASGPHGLVTSTYPGSYMGQILNGTMVGTRANEYTVCSPEDAAEIKAINAELQKLEERSKALIERIYGPL